MTLSPWRHREDKIGQVNLGRVMRIRRVNSPKLAGWPGRVLQRWCGLRLSEGCGQGGNEVLET